MVTDGLGSFFDYDGYEAFERAILDVPARAGLPAAVFDIGESVQGRKILCLRLGKATSSAPGAMYISLMHGLEFVSGDLCLAVIAWFLDSANRDEASEIVSRCPVYFIPSANPDSYEAAARARKKGDIFAWARKNAAGVDINRNFPAYFHPDVMQLTAASDLPFLPVYRGPRPFSEPESRAIRHFVESFPVKASLSFHSPGRFIGFPYCHTRERCPHHDELLSVASNMRRLQPYFKYKVEQEYVYLPTSGDLDDWLYKEHGIFPFLMEIGGLGLRPLDPTTWLNPFAWCNPPGAEKEILNNIPASVYLARWCAGM